MNLKFTIPHNLVIVFSIIIVFILMVGGALRIMNDTKAIDVGIFSFLGFTRRIERYRLVKWLKWIMPILLILVILGFLLLIPTVTMKLNGF